MFNVSKIADLYGAVGVRQPLDASAPIIDADNQTSRSGLYVTDNPLCKIIAIKKSQDYRAINDAQFNEYLKQMQVDSMNTVLTNTFNESSFIGRGVTYPNPLNRVNTVELPSGFIGERILIEKGNLAVKIDRVYLDFEGAGTINLMLFSTSSPDPIDSIDIVISSPNQTQELNWVIDNTGDLIAGEYFIGYLSNSATIGTLKPFARDFDRSNLRGSVCKVYADPVLFKDHSTDTLPDLSKRESISDYTGINLSMSVYNDYTDFIVRNESLFWQAFNTQFQIKFLEVIIASIRSNGEERRMKEVSRMVIAINGLNTEGHSKITGLSSILFSNIKNIRKEYNRLNKDYFGGKIQTKTMV